MQIKCTSCGGIIEIVAGGTGICISCGITYSNEQLKKMLSETQINSTTQIKTKAIFTTKQTFETSKSEFAINNDDLEKLVGNCSDYRQLRRCKNPKKCHKNR